MKSDKILVFIPAYNCEKQLPRVLAQLDHVIMSYITDVIIVNNCSIDGTVEAAKNYLCSHPEIPCKILNNNENYNLGGSHKVAFQYAIKNGFDYVIVLHGDDQADIHDFLPVLRAHAYRKADCVLGSRFMKGSELIGYSKIRIAGNYGFNFLFSAVAGIKITDLGSGLNMYRVETLRSNFFHQYSDTLYFNALMLLAYVNYGYTMKFYPISWREDDQISNAKLFHLSSALLKMLFSYTFWQEPFMKSDMREHPITRYDYTIIWKDGENV